MENSTWQLRNNVKDKYSKRDCNTTLSISGTEMNLCLREIALLFLAFLASAWSTNAQSQNNTIGCFVPFQCIGATSVGFTLTTTANECASFCKTISDCNYFTFYDTQGNCLAQRDCPGTDSECSDCISGIFLLSIY